MHENIEKIVKTIGSYEVTKTVPRWHRPVVSFDFSIFSFTEFKGTYYTFIENRLLVIAFETIKGSTNMFFKMCFTSEMLKRSESSETLIKSCNLQT